MLSSGRKLRDKHIEIGKREIEEVPLIESTPRYAEAAAEAAEPPALPLVDDTLEKQSQEA